VRQYFDKIKDAEDPAKRQLAIDKVAASRFIKHAIAQAKDTRPIAVSSSPTTHVPSNDNGNDNGASGSAAATAHDVRVPVIKVTEKMLERAKYHEALREEAQASDDGGDLEVFDGEDEPSDEAGRTPPEEDASSHSPLQATSSELGAAGKQKGKGKAKAVAGGTPIHDDVPPRSETAAGKRRRPPVDPFAGYGDGQDTAAPVDADLTTNTSRSGTKVRRVHKQDFTAEPSSGTNTPDGGEHQEAKRSKKRSKKKDAL